MSSLGHTAPASVASFYAASVVGLQALEARKPTGRRFGPDADALWRTFQGHLDTGDRIDLLLRDAAAAWPSAFAPTKIFGLTAVAEDDPFGTAWESLDAVHAEELWRGSAPSARSPFDWLAKCAGAWELKIKPVQVGAIDAGARILVVGPSAMASVANVFAENPDLDWADQVTCAASLPAHRHLAGLAAAVLNSAKGTAVVTSSDASKIKRPDRLIHSPDAFDADLAWGEAQMGA